jgi:SprT protein
MARADSMDWEERRLQSARNVVQHAIDCDGWLRYPGVVAFDTNANGFGPANPLQFRVHTFGLDIDTPLRYLAYCRALYYKDNRTADQILKAGTTADVVRLGRAVGPEIDPSWGNAARIAMKEAYTFRILAHPWMLLALAASKGCRIAYAHHRDSNWGTGLALDDQAVAFPAQWTGKNRLGDILVELRDEVFQDNITLFRLDSPIDEADKQAIIDTCRQYMNRANAMYSMSMPMPEIVFQRAGTAAGTARVCHNIIDINPVLASENFDDILTRTAPHEVAHIVQYQRFGVRSLKALGGHGKEWQGIMRDFGLEPSRYHSMSVANSGRGRNNPHMWSCKCQVHQTKKDGEYLCQKCNTRLTLITDALTLMHKALEPSFHV